MKEKSIIENYTYRENGLGKMRGNWESKAVPPN